MDVTLRVFGRKEKFSTEELGKIVEMYLQMKKEQLHEKNPQEGQCFYVDLETINYELFKEKRSDSAQEFARSIIWDAFEEVKVHPEKYEKPFKTMFPKKDWEDEMVKNLKDSASNFGGHLANWVEQALEWAQRISNGETWEKVCNEPDKADWQRLIVWKDGHTRKIGGSNKSRNYNPATCVCVNECYYYEKLKDTVPLVVIRDSELHTA